MPEQASQKLHLNACHQQLLMLDVKMRTTLTIDPEVADRLKLEAALGRRSFKAIVNDALRIGLGLEKPRRVQRYRVNPHSSRLLPGIDPTKLNQLVDELEAESFRTKHGSGQ